MRGFLGDLGRQLSPFTGWIGQLKDPAVLRGDLIAGVTVALILVPQSMAYAQLAGLPPHIGLYASFLPVMIAALFGSSHQLATGPVAVVSLMTASTLAPLAALGSEGYLVYAAVLAVMIGLFQLSLGVMRLGVLVDFLSHPVVLGFTNAAAIIIATSQIGKLFGVSVARAEHHYETVWRVLLAAMENTHLPTLLMGLLAIGIMVSLKKYLPKVPNVLTAVVATTLISFLFGFSQTHEATLADVQAPAVQQLVREKLDLKEELTRLREDLKTAENRLQTAVAQHGHNDARTVAATHARDRIKVAIESDRLAGAADLRELLALHFVIDTEGRLHLKGEHPATLDDATAWRVSALADDGGITLAGGGKVVGEVPKGLPGLRWPSFNLDILFTLATSAITIALIGFMEAISIAKAMASQTRQRLDPNQELVGQGLSNLCAGLFQGYAVSGSFSRSAVNLASGALTGFSSIVTGVVVALTLLFLTPLLYHLPQATLAAVIIMAVVNLIRIQPIRHAMKVQPHDGFVAIVTFVLTLIMAPHLDKGIIVGVVLSLGLYLYRSMHPRFAELSMHEDGTLRDAQVHGLETCQHISLFRFDGSLYFANAGYLENKVLESIADKPLLRFVVLDAEGINQVDATGEEVLRDLCERLKAIGIGLLITRAKKQLMDTFERTGFVEHIGRGSFFRRNSEAVDFALGTMGAEVAERSPLRRPIHKEQAGASS